MPRGSSCSDTVDPYRPLEVAYLKDLGATEALAACGTFVLAGGANGLFTVALANYGEPRYFTCKKV